MSYLGRIELLVLDRDIKNTIEQELHYSLISEPYHTYRKLYADIDIIVERVRTILGIDSQEFRELIESIYEIVDICARHCISLSNISSTFDIYRIISNTFSSVIKDVRKYIEKIPKLLKLYDVRNKIARVYELYTWFTTHVRDKLIEEMIRHGEKAELMVIINRSIAILQSLYRSLYNLITERPYTKLEILQLLQQLAGFFDFVLAVLIHMYKLRKINLRQLFEYTNMIYCDIISTRLIVENIDILISILEMIIESMKKI